MFRCNYIKEVSTYETLLPHEYRIYNVTHKRTTTMHYIIVHSVAAGTPANSILFMAAFNASCLCCVGFVIHIALYKLLPFYGYEYSYATGKMIFSHVRSWFR